jgi:hypothetical protein
VRRIGCITTRPSASHSCSPTFRSGPAGQGLTKRLRRAPDARAEVVDRLPIQRGSSAAAIAGTAAPRASSRSPGTSSSFSPKAGRKCRAHKTLAVLPKLSVRHPPRAETPQDMERYIELHLRESRQNQNADPVTRAVAGQSPLRRLGASSIHGHGWTLAHVGTSDGAESVQQQSTAVSPLLSVVQRGFAHTQHA